MIMRMEVLETEDPLGPYRSELFAHCYRMLGSHHDAEDVLQEVSLRALRGRAEFEGRSSLRTWLHRIAVNACLNELDHKERRIMPIDYGPEAGPDDGFDNRLEDILWVEPMPSDPQQRAEYLVSIELAFVVAVQHLPANQRAALIMFDVLGSRRPRSPRRWPRRRPRSTRRCSGRGNVSPACFLPTANALSSPTSVMPGSANS